MRSLTDAEYTLLTDLSEAEELKYNLCFPGITLREALIPAFENSTVFKDVGSFIVGLGNRIGI